MATEICFVPARRWMPLPNGMECGHVITRPAALRLSVVCLGFPIVVLCNLLLSQRPAFVWADSGSTAASHSRQEDGPRDVEPGVTYRAGTRLRIPGTDWSFVVPDQWQGSRPEDSEMPFLIAQEGKGLGMIFPLADVTREAVHDHFSHPLSLLHGLSFVPAGSTVETDRSIARSYQGENMLGRALAMFGSENRCIIYFIMGPQEEADGFEMVLERLAASTHFADPVPDREGGL
jgi:hypothetical protein